LLAEESKYTAGVQKESLSRIEIAQQETQARIDLAKKEAESRVALAKANSEKGITKAFDSFMNSMGSRISNFFTPNKKRATGGGVQIDQSYLVGERGPELFTPSGNGSIMPNHKLAGTGGMSLTINMNGGTYLDDNVAEKIGDRIIQNVKRSFRI